MSKEIFEDSEFRTSSYTGEGRWACVSVAIHKNVIGVRNTRDKSKTTLDFTLDEWKAFVKGVKDGGFDI